MLRINELKLPLDHTEQALTDALLARLGITLAELRGFTVFKRSYDARKRSAIVLIYSLDVEVKNEAQVLKRMSHDRQIMPSPDTGYKFVAQLTNTNTMKIEYQSGVCTGSEQFSNPTMFYR